MTTALSINLPENMADASKQASLKLGISRTQFIRRAISHELKRLEREDALDAMVEAFTAMNKDPDYLAEAQDIDESSSAPLPDDEDEWWTKSN